MDSHQRTDKFRVSVSKLGWLQVIDHFIAMLKQISSSCIKVSQVLCTKGYSNKSTPWTYCLYGNNFHYLDGNAPTYYKKHLVTYYLPEVDVNLIQPDLIPNLNPIELLRDALGRVVGEQKHALLIK